MRIPQWVHQIWMQGTNKVPGKYDKARQSWRAMHPPESGWTIQTWDEAAGKDLIRRVAPDFGMQPDALVQWYSSIPKLIQRCDILRCFILYAEGGVYADMDTLSLTPLTPLLAEADANATKHGAAHAFVYCKTINNAVFAASPRHPLFTEAWWPQVHDAVSGERKQMGWLSRTLSKWGPGLDVVYTTGPMMWGRILEGGLVYGGPGPSAQQLKAWGVLRPPHRAFYPKMNDACQLDAMTDATKVRLAAQGSYTYHSQEADWLTGMSVEGAYIAMTRSDTRHAVLVTLCTVLLLIGLLWAVVAACANASRSRGLVGGARRLHVAAVPMT